MRLGDALIIRSRATILGFAKVEGIDTELGTVQMRRCPQCGTSQFRERISMSPDYRCSNSHEFDQPTSETVPCTWYTISYAQSFTPVIPPADAQLLVPAYLNAGAQQSIRAVHPTTARSIATYLNPKASRVFD